jgi:uroporphyrinogen-III synthase
VSASLAGLRVLVTRPAAQAQPLCRQLAAAGAEPRPLPLLQIEPLPASPQLQRQFREARAAEAWIFTSANAVRHARGLDSESWPARLYAIGAATAAALAALGFGAATPDGEYSSEGLLQLPQLQQISGRRYALITGAEGLGLLAATLAARGALVDTVAVYRRVGVAHPPERVLAALQGAQAAIVTSGEALRQLLRVTPSAAQAQLRTLRLVVPSARVVELARELGFAPPLVPEHISDADFVRCLERWWSAQGFR